jgi:zinc protease
MSVNRSLCPVITPIGILPLRTPLTFDIAENCYLYWMDKTQSETVHVAFHFDAGTTTCIGPEAVFASRLLLSGTNSKLQAQIQNEIDQLGGYVNCSVGEENFSIHVYTLRNNLLPILHLVHEAFDGAIFPEAEIQDLIREEVQSFLTNTEKVSYLASLQFRQKVYGNDIPYVKNVNEDFYKNIDRSDLIQFYRKQLKTGMKRIEVVGDLDTEIIDEIIDLWGAHAILERMPVATSFVHQPGFYHVEKVGALQSAIRIGRPVLDFHSPDSIEFDVLNTILGGYFGSRLMSNIREDKGYTYGINSSVVNYSKASGFQIGTEVKDEVIAETLSEIKKEINRLKNEMIDGEELELVKNYILGETQASIDGAGAMLSTYTGLLSRGKSLEYVNDSLDRVRAITPAKLQHLANQFLDWEDFVIVVAGATKVSGN